jgi:hypothetical protein
MPRDQDEEVVRLDHTKDELLSLEERDHMSINVSGDAAREQRLRRIARRQGLAIQKSRSRDPRSLDFGTYGIFDPYTNTIVAHGSPWNGYGLDLDAVEAQLLEGEE